MGNGNKKPGCRKCGEISYHFLDCGLNASSFGVSPVLDSKRSIPVVETDTELRERIISEASAKIHKPAGEAGRGCQPCTQGKHGGCLLGPEPLRCCCDFSPSPSIEAGKVETHEFKGHADAPESWCVVPVDGTEHGYCGQPKAAEVHKVENALPNRAALEAEIKRLHEDQIVECAHRNYDAANELLEQEKILRAQLPVLLPIQSIELPARVWIDRSQIGSHRKHGNYYLFNFDDATAVEYLAAEPLRKALIDCLEMDMGDCIELSRVGWERLCEVINGGK